MSADKSTKGTPARKETLAENAVAAAFLGLLAVLVAAAGLLVGSGAEREERKALAELSGRRVAPLAMAVGGQDFERVYVLEGKGARRYGAVALVGTPRGSALAAFVLAADGELEAAKLLGEGTAGQPYSREGWFSEFLGRGAERAYPRTKAASRSPEALSGATESFAATADLLASLSAAVRRVAEKKE